MEFVYKIDRAGRKVSVVATGEIDVTTAWPFGAALCEIAASEPTDVIEVDFGGLIFIDSTGTSALKRAYRTVARHGCTLVVTNATGLVRRVFELTGTLSHLSPRADADTHQTR
jgi:stage II sporulation protein AA (anti-sigma F factor antagonist)